MKQLVMQDFGFDKLKVIETYKPEPKHGEIRVKMHALSLNYVDLIVIRGELGLDSTFPYVPISDGAGEIDAVGEGVTGLKKGDRVASLFIPDWQDRTISKTNHAYSTRPGLGIEPGQASGYKVAASHKFIKLPDTMDYMDAACLPVAGLTAWSILKLGRLTAGQTLLTHGTGGVSLFALQIGKAMGANVIITTSKNYQTEFLKQLGADAVINYKENPDWDEEVLSFTDGRGVDVVAETAGYPTIQKSLEALRFQGFIGLVGLIGKFEVTLSSINMLHKSATIRGLEVGSTQDFYDFLDFLKSSPINPVVSKTFPLDEIQDALMHLESGQHVGKITITF